MSRGMLGPARDAAPTRKVDGIQMLTSRMGWICRIKNSTIEDFVTEEFGGGSSRSRKKVLMAAVAAIMLIVLLILYFL